MSASWSNEVGQYTDGGGLEIPDCSNIGSVNIEFTQQVETGVKIIMEIAIPHVQLTPIIIVVNGCNCR